MRPYYKVLILLPTLCAFGCTPSPMINYTMARLPGDVPDDIQDAFYFQKSQIVIDRIGEPEDSASLGAFSVISKPIAMTDVRVIINKATETPGVRTNINLKKIENTDLISEAGIEVDDQRIQLITDIGSTIATALPLLAFAVALEEINTDKFPLLIDVQQNIKSIGREAGNVILRTDDEKFNLILLEFGPIPVEAKDITSFQTSFTSSELLFSACRDVAVTFNSKGRYLTKTVRVSDARYISRVGFPAKGSVRLHSECGVSVTTEKATGISSDAAIVAALAEQAKAVKEAYDAAGANAKKTE